MYVCMYVCVYVCGIHFEPRFFESEWDSNLRPRAYRAHALTTELSGQIMRRA